jgi:flagellar assembly factor FliW
MTANLQGPVLVNGENRWAKQLVLTNSQYHTRHPLLAPLGTAE